MLRGTADIAFVVPGLEPQLFRDNTVIELPGLYRDLREASLVYTGLIESRRLKGYDDFFVIGAFSSEPEIINTRKPIATWTTSKVCACASTTPSEADAVAQFGMRPVLMPINQVLNAITSHSIDAVAIAEAMLSDFGIGRVITYHYQLAVGQAPLGTVDEPQGVRQSAGACAGRSSANTVVDGLPNNSPRFTRRTTNRSSQTLRPTPSGWSLHPPRSI